MSIRTVVLANKPSAVNGKTHLITSADKLLAAWACRDRLYATRATALDAAAVTQIRRQRAWEVGFVEPRRRGPLFVRARHWSPPALGEWA